jgi:hypothetical protein
MSDIDWSKAPEGATHYNIITRMFYMLTGGESFLWNYDEWADSAWTTSEVKESSKFIPRPTKPAAPEWEGKLPPAGIECQAWDYVTHQWTKCKTLDAKTMSGEMACATIEEKGHFGKVFWGLKFRPIRTQAERDREDLAECVAKTATLTLGKVMEEWQYDAIADAILSAGWRKEPKP